MEAFAASTLSKIKIFYRCKFLATPSVYDKIFNKLQLEKTYGDCKDLKVLDLYPGPAQQSLIFHNRYKPKQHLLLDNRIKFVKFWEENLNSIPFQRINLDPYDWKTYLYLIDETKQFEPEKQSRDHINNKLLVMANLTDKKMEGLVMQWYNCIGQRNWIYRFGRVKMLLWVSTTTAIKLLALPGYSIRQKCSVVRETFTNTKLIALTEDKEAKNIPDEVILRDDPIWINHNDTLPTKADGNPMALLEIDPLDFEVNKEIWDYVTQNLMILRQTPLIESIESLGPGALDYYTKTINNPDFMKKKPNSLSAKDYLNIADLFEKWPFKPDIYLNFYSHSQDD